MKRDQAIEAVNDLPEAFELETLMERLVFVEKVAQGLQELKEDKTVSHDQVKEMAKKW